MHTLSLSDSAAASKAPASPKSRRRRIQAPPAPSARELLVVVDDLMALLALAQGGNTEARELLGRLFPSRFVMTGRQPGKGGSAR